MKRRRFIEKAAPLGAAPFLLSPGLRSLHAGFRTKTFLPPEGINSREVLYNGIELPAI